MKKLLLLFAVLAAATTTSAGNFEPEKLYTLLTYYGYMPKTPDATAVKDKSRAGEFRITEADGGYLIYNTSLNQYLSANGGNAYVSEPNGTFSIYSAAEEGGSTFDWVIKSNVNDCWMFYGDGGYYLNSNSWRIFGRGMEWSIREVGADEVVKVFDIDGINYQILDFDAKTVKTFDSPKAKGDIVLTATVPFNGVDYKLVRIGNTMMMDAIRGGQLTIDLSGAKYVEEIGYQAFAGCKIKSPELPAALKNISEGAFASCDMAEVIIPASVKTIGDNAFYGCKNLLTVTSLSTTPPALGKDCFANIPANCMLNIPAEALDAYKAAEGWGSFTKIRAIGSVMGDEFTEGGIKYAVTAESPNEVELTGFSADQLAGSLVIPATVSYGGKTFTVSTFAQSVFEQCTQLTSVNIQSPVAQIPKNMFRKCTSLASVALPATVTQLEASAFNGCTKLTEIISLSTTAPTVATTTFTSVKKESCTVKVPAEALDAYKAAEGWNKFANIVALTDDEMAALGIAAAPAGSSNKTDRAYSLTGAQVGEDYKGIVIKGGRKYINAQGR